MLLTNVCLLVLKKQNLSREDNWQLIPDWVADRTRKEEVESVIFIHNIFSIHIRDNIE